MTILNLTIATDADDAHQASIANDSGRTFTSSGVVTDTGTLSPGSHGSGDEYSAGFEFTGASGIVGQTINSADFSIVADAPYSAAPNVVSYHLSAHDADTPAGLSTTNGDLNSTNRPRTTADAGEWVLTSVTGGVRYTRSCTAVIQELADRPSFNGTIIPLMDTHANTTVNEWQDFDQLSAELDIDYGAGGGPTLEQEGFRFRNDDGSESAATWRQAQDTDDSIATETPFRLRILTNATGDPANQALKLQYRKVGASAWRDVKNA